MVDGGWWMVGKTGQSFTFYQTTAIIKKKEIIMARKSRIDRIGFYHILNRGVARKTIYKDPKDYIKFLTIVEEASGEYGFEVYSYCLMGNHYHLLLKTNQENLSLLMQKINARYSIYFNKKYHRVGPLWQGRFKSWFVYDEKYLDILVRYIEFNPIKANIAKNIGEYEWAMSSKNVTFSMLNFKLIDMVDLSNNFSQKEQEKLNELFGNKIEVNEDNVILKKSRTLQKIFDSFEKEEAIRQAVKEGYKQSEIAKFLNLSPVSISKIFKIFKQKRELFYRLRDKGLFWSYSKSMEYNGNLLIEYTLKYADFDDIVLLLKLFGKRKVKSVWDKTMKSDSRFIKLNLMIARVFFGMDVESDYFKRQKNERLEKLKLLAS